MSVGGLLLHKYPEKFWILQVMKHPQRFEPNAELAKEDGETTGSVEGSTIVESLRISSCDPVCAMGWSVVCETIDASALSSKSQ